MNRIQEVMKSGAELLLTGVTIAENIALGAAQSSGVLPAANVTEIKEERSAFRKKVSAKGKW